MADIKRNAFNLAVDSVAWNIRNANHGHSVSRAKAVSGAESSKKALIGWLYDSFAEKVPEAVVPGAAVVTEAMIDDALGYDGDGSAASRELWQLTSRAQRGSTRWEKLRAEARGELLEPKLKVDQLRGQPLAEFGSQLFDSFDTGGDATLTPSEVVRMKGPVKSMARAAASAQKKGEKAVAGGYVAAEVSLAIALAVDAVKGPLLARCKLLTDPDLRTLKPSILRERLARLDASAVLSEFGDSTDGTLSHLAKSFKVSQRQAYAVARAEGDSTIVGYAVRLVGEHDGDSTCKVGVVFAFDLAGRKLERPSLEVFKE